MVYMRITPVIIWYLTLRSVWAIRMLFTIYSGQALERVERTMDRDTFMDPEQVVNNSGKTSTERNVRIEGAERWRRDLVYTDMLHCCKANSWVALKQMTYSRFFQAREFGLIDEIVHSRPIKNVPEWCIISHPKGQTLRTSYARLRHSCKPS